MPTTAQTDALWVSRRHAAELVDLSPRQFDDAVRPRLPDGAAQGEGKKLRYLARAVVSTLIEQKLEQARERAAEAVARAQAAGADESDGDGDRGSPELERGRRIRANLLELEYGRELGQLIPRAELEPALGSLAGVLRRAAERLAREHGDAAARVLNKAVDDAEHGWRALLAPPAADGPSPGTPGEAAGK